MKRKLKLINWLKLVFFWIPFVLLITWGSYHQFYKSYPEIPNPPSEYYVPTNSLTVSVPIVETTADKVVGGSVVKFDAGNEFYSLLTGARENIQSKNSVDENLKEELELEIDNLKLRKIDLKKNIAELENLNTKLSKLSFEMQEAIIKFVEKNRVRDIFASAFVGAVISVLFTFILTRPVITKKIDSWLFKDINA